MAHFSGIKGTTTGHTLHQFDLCKQRKQIPKFKMNKIFAIFVLFAVVAAVSAQYYYSSPYVAGGHHAYGAPVYSAPLTTAWTSHYGGVPSYASYAWKK